MKIAIGNDHSAVEMKNMIVEYLTKKGHEMINFGTDSTESYPYPKAASDVAHAVVNKQADCGILICGTGVGIGIAANKIKEIDPKSFIIITTSSEIIGRGFRGV